MPRARWQELQGASFGYFSSAVGLLELRHMGKDAVRHLVVLEHCRREAEAPVPDKPGTLQEFR